MTCSEPVQAGALAPAPAVDADELSVEFRAWACGLTAWLSEPLPHECRLPDRVYAADGLVWQLRGRGVLVWRGPARCDSEREMLRTWHRTHGE